MHNRNSLCLSWILLLLLVFYLGGLGTTVDIIEDNAAISPDKKIDLPPVFNTPAPATEETNRLPLQDDSPSEITLEKKYVGSLRSNKYHLPECEWAREILPSNQIWFSSREEAESKGYIPCKVCKP